MQTVRLIQCSYTAFTQVVLNLPTSLRLPSCPPSSCFPSTCLPTSYLPVSYLPVFLSPAFLSNQSTPTTCVKSHPISAQPWLEKSCTYSTPAQRKSHSQTTVATTQPAPDSALASSRSPLRFTVDSKSPIPTLPEWYQAAPSQQLFRPSLLRVTPIVATQNPICLSNKTID